MNEFFVLLPRVLKEAGIFIMVSVFIFSSSSSLFFYFFLFFFIFAFHASFVFLKNKRNCSADNIWRSKLSFGFAKGSQLMEHKYSCNRSVFI
jgi:hypothetical protein